MIDLERVDKAFKEYTSQFDFDKEKISMKYYHTLEVAKLCNRVALDLKLSKEEALLATLIGYLHDIGRFLQYTKTNSFNDFILDHADLGVKILFEDNLIRKFIDDDKYDEIIKKAVRNHNKYKIKDGLSDTELLFAKLIRDCDKIDILRLRLGKSDEIIESPTDEVINTFKSGKPIKLYKGISKTDAILCVMAFIFDFNYKESISVLNEKGYYLDFINNIKVEPSKSPWFNELKEQVLKRLEV